MKEQTKMPANMVLCTEDHIVVAVGKSVKRIKVGDRIEFNKQYLGFTYNGVKYSGVFLGSITSTTRN